MKVLGQVKEEGYIVEMSNEELAQLLGWGTSLYSEERKKVVVGHEIKLGKCYANAQEIIGFYQSIKGSVSTLKSASTKILDFISEKENPVAAKIVQ